MGDIVEFKKEDNNYNANSFGTLLIRSYQNLEILNKNLDTMQEYFDAMFPSLEVEDQVKIYKAEISRAKFEAQLHNSIMQLVSKNEQVAQIIKALLSVSEDPNRVAKIRPEIKAITDTLKDSIKEDL